MKPNQPKDLHPLLQEIIRRLVTSGAGDVLITDDGHLFLRPCACFKAFWGAMDMKKEGKQHGVRIVVRKVSKRAKNSRYANMPLLQMYVLPIVRKNAATMTDAERRNIEMNTRALKMAHAVERDPEQSAYYHTLHEAHRLNPAGYSKCYNNFFGFLVATFRMQLEAAEAAKTSSAAHSKSCAFPLPLSAQSLTLSRRLHPYLPRAA